MRELAIGTNGSNLGMTHNPTVNIGSEAAGNYVTTPYDVTEAILFGAVQNFLKILKDATGIDLDVGNWLRDLPTFGEWLGSLAVSASRIFGKPWPSLFDLIPLEAIGKRFTNYLNNGVFDSPECLIDADRWAWDGTQKYPEDETAGETRGSVYVDPNGMDNDLCSNPVNVVEGQNVYGKVMTKWGNGFVATDDAISLIAEGLYVFEDQAIVMDEVVLEAVISPGAIGDWEELAGDYVVPPGCNAVRLVLHVGSSATAGRVWFSDALLGKKETKGLFGIDLISGLQDVLSGIDNFVQGVVGFIGAAIEGIFNPFALLQDLGEWIASWFDDTQHTAGEASDALGYLQDVFRLFTRIFGPSEQPTFAAAEQAVIDLNGRIVALEGGGVITTYTVNGVWTNPTPTEHNRIKVIVYCGGDGGGRPSTNYMDQAKGGSGGGYVEMELFTDELPATVAMTIGAGGAGATTGGGDGGVGAVTSFGSIVVGRKGVGAIYKDGAKLPERGVPPGDGGRGAFVTTSTDGDVLLASSEGTGGAFAPGGRAGFGSSGSSINGKNGGAAAALEPSGGGGGGGGSAGSAGQAGDGGNGGFPGGGGGGAAKQNATYGIGGNGAQGAIQIVTEAA